MQGKDTEKTKCLYRIVQGYHGALTDISENIIDPDEDQEQKNYVLDSFFHLANSFRLLLFYYIIKILKCQYR